MNDYLLLNQRKLLINHQLFICIVFLEDMKIEVSSDASTLKGSIRFSGFSFSSIINWSQNSDSSTSSITILSFDAKAALLCAKQAAL